MRTIRGPEAGRWAGKALVPRGAAGGAQFPKRRSSWPTNWFSGRSPTAKIVALSGRIQLWWKAISSSRVRVLTAAGSPLPDEGFA